MAAAPPDPRPPARRRTRTRERITAEIVVDSPVWKAQPQARRIVRRAFGAAADGLPSVHGDVSVLLTDDAAMRVLNRDWRGFDKPTNVLSFPAAKSPASGLTLLGDIVVAYETTAREASEQGKPFAHHLSHLAVHGLLHLLGYDHEHDADAAEMEETEITILARLDVPDPYVARDAMTDA